MQIVSQVWDLEKREDVARLAGHVDFVWSPGLQPGRQDADLRLRRRHRPLVGPEPLRLRHQARRAIEVLRPEAEQLVERLFQEKKEASRVVQALKDDKEFSELLRRAAFHALLRRAQANH